MHVRESRFFFHVFWRVGGGGAWGVRRALRAPCLSASRQWETLSEVVRSDHHCSGAQGITGPTEVVPLDAIKLSDVVAHGVVDPVEVGEAAGVEPPPCGGESRAQQRCECYVWHGGKSGGAIKV